ncbi:MAG: hypothetical protein JW801_15170, partial [Bacteroidales bacterium]|nr:hypothetical protein [Bacteroidales bacterium]
MKKLIISIILFVSLIFIQALQCQVVLSDTLIELSNGYSIIRLFSQNGYSCDYLFHGNADDAEIITGQLGSETPETEEGDILENTLWLPDPDGGAMPQDAVLSTSTVDGKIYIFGNRRLVVKNAATGSTIKSLTISSYGNIFATQAYLLNPFSRYLAISPEDTMIYCATFGNELHFIDGKTDEIVQTISEASFGEQLSTSIYYVENTNRLYWILNSWVSSKLRMFDFNTGLQEELALSEQIYDFTPDANGDYIYLSTKTAVKTLDAAQLSVEQSYTTGASGALVFDQATSKLYAQMNGNWPNAGPLHYFSNSGLYQGSLSTGIISVIGRCSRPLITGVTDDSKIYFSGVMQNGYSVKIINGTTQLISTVNTPKPLFSIAYKLATDKIFGGSTDLTMSIDGYSDDMLDTQTLRGCESRRIKVLPENSDNVYSLNTGEGTVFRIQDNCQYNEFVQTGMSSYKGCYNTQNDKSYFAQCESDYQDGIVSVYDNNNNWLTTVEDVGQDITSIVYNEASNKIFVACYGDGNVTIISGITNSIIAKIIVTGTGEHEQVWPRLLLSYDEYVYVAGYEGIAYINAITHATEIITDEILSIPTDIEKDEVNQQVYFAYPMVSPDIYSVVHSLPAPYINNTYWVGGSFPVSITYHPVNNKVYIGNFYPDLGSILELTPGLNYVKSYGLNHPIRHVEKNPFRKYLYALGEYDVYGYLSVIDITDPNPVPVNTFTIKRSNGLVYNPINDKILTHEWYPDYGNEISLHTVDSYDNAGTKDIATGNMIPMPAIMNFSQYSKAEPFFNKNFNKLYFGNHGFSNASVIKCYADELSLTTDITWLSLPRMGRYENNEYYTDSVLMRNNWYPQVGFDLEGYFLPDDEFKHRIFEPPNWDGLFTTVKSTQGCKLDFAASELPTPKIELHGAIVPPETELTIYGNNEANWLGYFLKDAQWVKDAIPANIYDHYLTSIQTQYWSKHKIWGFWVATGKETPLEYGDMVILKMNYGGSVEFQWNMPSEPADDVVISETEYFTFEEELDYVPFYIQTDSTSDIKEIGAMVNGECYGATVRNPGDTLVEVDSYIFNVPPGSVVEFETWDGYKASGVEKGSYAVYNPLNGNMEKRNIYAGERQEYYLVSLKSSVNSIIPGDISSLECFPNPVNGHCRIVFRLNNETFVDIAL